MACKLDILEVNKLSENDFEKIFGNIVECFPKVAKYLYTKIPFNNTNEILFEALIFLDILNLDDKETILKLHPDLAGKLADEGKLTNESTEEQKAAGLDKLTVTEKCQLNDLNQKYKIKFGFPFVICARENKAGTILKGLKVRLNNKKEEELSIGIAEVKKICKLRLQDIIVIY